MIKLFKNQKGMTLVELLVAMVLLGIITTSVSAVFLPVLQTYARANSLAERNTLLNNVANQMISDISEAVPANDRPDSLWDYDADNKLSINMPGNVVTYSVSDGVLLKNGIAVLSKRYYNNKSVSFKCTEAPPAAGTAYILTVTVESGKGGGTIDRDYMVRPLALNQY